MDNQRLLIWGIFAFLCWITYQTWLQDFAPPAAPAPVAAQTTPAIVNGDDELPAISNNADDAINATISASDTPAIADTPAAASAPTVTVRTDVLDLVISTRGGTIESALLRRYPVDKDRPDALVQLLSTQDAQYGVLQTGLQAVQDSAKVGHNEIFSAQQNSYELGSADELVVPLVWDNGAGIRVEKRLRLKRGSYAIVIEQELMNNTDGLWRGAEYAQLKHYSREQERSMFDVDSYSFDGPIIFDGEKSEKLKRDDLLDDGPKIIETSDGWFASIEHHFLAAVIPAAETLQKYRVSLNGNRSTSNAIGPLQSVAPGSTRTFSTTTFVGPKLQAQLDEIHPKLNLTVDYGFLTILSDPLFWLLSAVFNFVGNWGVAIIVVTFLIKLVFYKLTESSGRSMAKMRNLQPRMKAMQERYKDDKPALSQAMMELYKREKVNPAAGCLPILIQMPFFLAFYWVLLESVEMRQAPFALWLTDLSTRDPYFILPVIMGGAMLMQQKLNPAPADPIQAKVMQVMPIMFTAFFAFFPSGLVLYWVTNTLLSIAQQWKINKVVEAESKQPNAGRNKS